MADTLQKRQGAPGAFGALGNEKGFALILAIAMLAILSILGAVALTTSSTEFRITGNYQKDKQTFYAGDRAVEYATNREMLITMGSSVNLMVDDSEAHKNRINAGGGGNLVSGLVTDLGPSDLPAKLKGAYGSDFGANLYHITVETEDATASVNKSRVGIDTTIVRLFKNDDDSIFRTTGAGG
ncbi:MAG: pilus assembly PilX N-terminal domain-containing protein [Desulfuromonadales bacterium]